MPQPILRAALAATAIALVPATTASLAAEESIVLRKFQPLFQAFLEVRAKYVEQVSDEKLVKGAIEGMLTSLDPHSGYLEGSDYANLDIQTKGNYGGLGLSVAMEDGAVKVIAPTEDTPADRAGIKSGDYITHLDGTLIVGGTLDEAVDQMRGRPGTSIRLSIARPGRDAPFEVTLTREVIQIKPVKWEVKNGVGIVNINGFSADTARYVVGAIKGIEAQLGKEPAGYVIDLRSNPGGLLDQAVGVSDVFLSSGQIVAQRGRLRDDSDEFFAETMVRGDITGGAPIVVLIDAGSASAAEIVAGAIQDHKRGLVMGERSFGKGSVQTVVTLTEDTALRLTTARYYTPSGRSVQEGGIEPDILVPQISDPDYKTRPRIREADFRRHLINETKVENRQLEADAKADPRFAMTPEQLKAKGIEDFQLTYAVEAVLRASRGQALVAASAKRPGR